MGARWVAAPAGARPLATLAEQTRGVVECYDTIVRVLLAWMESSSDGVLRSGLIREAESAFEGAQLLGQSRRSEGLSQTSLQNALGWLVDRGIIESESIETGKRNTRDTRYSRGENWEELAEVADLLASALRDR